MDEYIFGYCPDPCDTQTKPVLDRIQQHYADKVRLVEFSWPDVPNRGGYREGAGQSISLAQTTTLRHCTGEYAWLIQADEVYWDVMPSIIREVIDRRVFPEASSFHVRFDHVIENFARINPDPLYTWAPRIVRNTPDISSIYDGTEFSNADPAQCLLLPRNVCHVGSVGYRSAREKCVSHADLYPDSLNVQESAKQARRELDRGDFGTWRRTAPLIPIPPILDGLCGIASYDPAQRLERALKG